MLSVNVTCQRHGVFADLFDRKNSRILISELLCNMQCEIFCPFKTVGVLLQQGVLTLNIPSLARQRCLSSWGPKRTAGVLRGPHGFFVISQLFDAVDYSNYVFWVSETIIQ